jgi:hypothetical protein
MKEKGEHIAVLTSLGKKGPRAGTSDGKFHQCLGISSCSVRKRQRNLLKSWMWTHGMTCDMGPQATPTAPRDSVFTCINSYIWTHLRPAFQPSQASGPLLIKRRLLTQIYKVSAIKSLELSVWNTAQKLAALNIFLKCFPVFYA